jgi:Holliday junction resolvase
MTRTEPFNQQVLPDLIGFNELKVYFFFSVKKGKNKRIYIKV